MQLYQAFELPLEVTLFVFLFHNKSKLKEKEDAFDCRGSESYHC